MRSVRGVIIAAVFLAIIGWSGWYYLSRPPYRFLAGGKLTFINDTPFGLSEEFQFTKPFAATLELAKREVIGTWKDKPFGGIDPKRPHWIGHEIFVGTSFISITEVNPAVPRPPNDRYPPIPDGVTAVVRTGRPSGFVDRLRAKFYMRKWGGSRRTR